MQKRGECKGFLHVSDVANAFVQLLSGDIRELLTLLLVNRKLSNVCWIRLGHS